MKCVPLYYFAMCLSSIILVPMLTELRGIVMAGVGDVSLLLFMW